MIRRFIFILALAVATSSHPSPARAAAAVWYVYRGGGVYEVYQWDYALQMWMYQYTTVVPVRVDR